MECELPKRAEVQGDKGYAGELNRRLLENGGYKESLMRKTNRNKPLEESDQIRNASISKTRWVIERALGLLKNVRGFTRSRYRCMVKVEMEFHLHALVHNLKKAINLSS